MIDDFKLRIVSQVLSDTESYDHVIKTLSDGEASLFIDARKGGIAVSACIQNSEWEYIKLREQNLMSLIINDLHGADVSVYEDAISALQKTICKLEQIKESL